MEGKNEGLKRTSKFLSIEEAAKRLEDQESTVKMKQEEKSLEDIPDYEAKLGKYYRYKELFAELQDTVDRPLSFYYSDPAEVKKDSINRYFGIEVAKVLHTTLGSRDNYKVVLDTELMRGTFKDIFTADGKKILGFRKNIAA